FEVEEAISFVRDLDELIADVRAVDREATIEEGLRVRAGPAADLEHPRAGKARAEDRAAGLAELGVVLAGLGAGIFAGDALVGAPRPLDGLVAVARHGISRRGPAGGDRAPRRRRSSRSRR